MSKAQARDIDELLRSHLEMVQDADEWEASIETTAAQGTHAEKLARIESLTEIAVTFDKGMSILRTHSPDAIYASETPETAASVLALFDHLERLRGIAGDGAELLREHL